MKKVVVSCEMPQKMIDKIKNVCPYEIALCEKYERFENAVSAHPDMNYLEIGNKTFTISDVIYNSSNNKDIKLKYPNDVILNAFCIGKDLICKKKSVASDVLDYAKTLDMNIINVNQGYVKCNIAVVSESDKAIITEDKGIEEVLTQNGYDILLLDEHAVQLKPYDYGFIGGASGLIDGKLLFSGNIKKHPEYEKISSFCARYGTDIISLSDDALYDYGSILLIEFDREEA